MEAEPSISFPVIRGLQAKREYYVAMWTLRMIRQISIFDEDELPPEHRAQRNLNKSRIPEISNYMLDNSEDYIFSALTVSIDSEVSFEALPGQDKLGMLRVPMEARFIINDGQHRRAAIIEALNQRPELAHETIAVVFFLDIGLELCQQMFADLNRHAIRPSRSLGLLYDHRNDKAKLAKLVVLKSSFFRDIVDLEKTSLAKRSRKLFTLSAFYNACADLLEGLATGNLEEDADLARKFWEATAKHFPAWGQVRKGGIPASEIREGYIHSHGIALQSIAKAGNVLLRKNKNWLKYLKDLEKIDWSRANIKLWEGRAMHAGKVSKSSINIILTSNVIKKQWRLQLSEEEQRIDDTHLQNKNWLTSTFQK
ncbi:MAG: DNA sulfur modification protein DndB [Desulfobacula sp.]|nr:DNA sulfur modification protein DndB [Desulfobacula sp.]